MSTKTMNALYDDDDILLSAVKHVREENYIIEEIFTPFPVHGLEAAMGLKDTRMAIAAFLYGLLGLGFAVWFLNYIMIVDWPQNIGGKPSFYFYMNMPAFIPIMFEMTVFFSAHLLVITLYMRSKLWPFKKAENPDPRTTDDKFLMEVLVKDGDEKQLKDLLEKTGAIEISLKEDN